jgi:hypothetical protein
MKKHVLKIKKLKLNKFLCIFLPEQLAKARAQLPQLYGFSPATGES